MRVGLAGTTIVLTAFVISGCAGGSAATTSTAQSAAAAKAGQDKARSTATDAAASKAQAAAFIPLLERDHAKVSWPQKYPMSVEKMWALMAPNVHDMNLTEVDAVSVVGIWAQCAWVMQVRDDVKARQPVDADVAKLAAVGGRLGHDDFGKEIITKIAGEVALGDLTSAQGFISANTCSMGFPS